MDYLEYKGYKGSIEYSKEDNCLFGKVQGISKALILYEGQSLDELRKDFEEGIDSYIKSLKRIRNKYIQVSQVPNLPVLTDKVQRND